MFLIVVFLSALILFFLWGRYYRKVGTLDALHRATVAAILMTLLALMFAIATSYI